MLYRMLERKAGRTAAVAVYVAACMPVLIAIVALAIDAGMLFDKRRHAQANSDAFGEYLDKTCPDIGAGS